MVGLVIHWDIHPDMVAMIGGAKRWLSTYIFAMEAFGADKLFVVGRPGVSHGYNIQHTEHDSLSEIVCDNHDVEVVVLTGSAPDGLILHDLSGYTHPQGDVLYVVGGDYSGVDFNVCTDLDVSYLRIDNLIDSSVLWSNIAASIVLRDRYVKGL